MDRVAKERLFREGSISKASGGSEGRATQVKAPAVALRQKRAFLSH